MSGILTRAALGVAAMGLLPLFGQDAPTIATDRPAVTNSSVVVPQGSLQVENGLLESNSEGHQGFDGPESLFRFGVAPKTELRFAAPNYVRNYSPATGLGSGFSDLSLGMKRQLGPTPGGFDVSLILYLSMPSGANALSSHGYDPAVQLPWSRKLSENWTAAGMLSLYWPTQGARRNLTGEPTFLLDRQLTKTWDAFVEYAGDFAQAGGPRHLLHFGTAYKIADRHQLDLHAGVSLSSSNVPWRGWEPILRHHFVGVGYSFLFAHAR